MASVLQVRSRIRASRSTAARIPSLVSMTLDRLATQAALHARGQAKESWISVGQLRDDVLREELRGARREEVWKKVKTIVEGNANVRAAVRESRSGDVARVWEWIGGIKEIEAPGGAKMIEAPSGVKMIEGASSPGTPGPGGQLRIWNEGTPVY